MDPDLDPFHFHNLRDPVDPYLDPILEKTDPDHDKTGARSDRHEKPNPDPPLYQSDLTLFENMDPDPNFFPNTDPNTDS